MIVGSQSIVKDRDAVLARHCNRSVLNADLQPNDVAFLNNAKPRSRLEYHEGTIPGVGFVEDNTPSLVRLIN